MKRPGVNPPPVSRRKKWVRRGVYTAGALLAAAVMSPFVFTGALVRYYLAHSDYRNVPIRFGSARLSVFGKLTIRDLVIEDTGESAGRKLLSADEAAVEFAWSGVRANRVKTILLTNVDAELHPGTDTSLTFLRLLSPAAPKVDGPAVAAIPAEATTPFWFDQLLVTGKIRAEGYEPWLALSQVHAQDEIPVVLRIKSDGSAANPARDVDVILGEDGSATKPYANAHFTVANGADGTTLAFDRFVLANVAPEASEAVLAAWPNVPQNVRRAAGGHFERLSASGSLTIGKEILVGATAELRDFSARSADGAVVLEHVTVGTRMDGKIGGVPGKDLRFARTRLAWESGQVAGWRLQKGVADLQIDGREIALDMQANYADAQVAATGAFDLNTGLLSRGRVWLKDFSCNTLIEHLPAEVRGRMPTELNGKLTARIFLSESDAQHVAAQVELACPDDLVLHGLEGLWGTHTAPPGRSAGVAGTSQKPVEGSSNSVQGPPAAPVGIVNNLDISGTVSWNYNPASVPEILHGRLTADDVVVSAPGRSEGLAVSRVRSDFTVVHGAARLDDFYAELPNNGRISAGGDYSTSTGTFEDATLSLNGVDLAMLNPWLPPGWTMAGQLDTEVRAGFTPNDVTITASAGLASQTMLKSKNGTLTVSGPAPALALRATMDFRTRAAQVQLAELTGVGVIQADGGVVKLARDWRRPAAGSGLDSLLNSVKSGAFVSFDNIGFAGAARMSDMNGTLSLSGLDVGSDPEKPALLNLTFKAGVAAAFDDPELKRLRVSDGQFLAEKITLGQSVMTEITGKVSAEQGKAALTGGKFSFAEGKVEAEGVATLPEELESLHLDFTGVHQQTLMRSLYPDVFTAEGPISGDLSLFHTQKPGKGGMPYAGTLTLAADLPGRLKISRAAAKGAFAPLARAAAAAPDSGGGVLPADFDEIVTAQLADYPYVTGRATLVDDAGGGLQVLLDYTREGLKEGEPGYGVPVVVAGQSVKANLEFQLRGGSLTIGNASVLGVLGRMVGK